MGFLYNPRGRSLINFRIRIRYTIVEELEYCIIALNKSWEGEPGNTVNYAVAVRLSEAWYFIPIAITGSLFPAIIKAKKISAQLYHDRFQMLCDLIVWLAIAIAIPITFFADDVVNILFGIGYSKAGTALSIRTLNGYS